MHLQQRLGNSLQLSEVSERSQKAFFFNCQFFLNFPWRGIQQQATLLKWFAQETHSSENHLPINGHIFTEIQRSLLRSPVFTTKCSIQSYKSAFLVHPDVLQGYCLQLWTCVDLILVLFSCKDFFFMINLKKNLKRLVLINFKTY